jgi:hypothetical protein
MCGIRGGQNVTVTDLPPSCISPVRYTRIHLKTNRNAFSEVVDSRPENYFHLV